MSTQNPPKTPKQGKDFIKTKDNDISPPGYWQRFKAGNTLWLENFYSKQNIKRQVIDEVLNKHKASLDKMKNLIEQRQAQNKYGKYMKKFAECRSQSYMSFKVQFNSYASSILPSQQQITEYGYDPTYTKPFSTLLHEFRIDRYKNYMNLTNLLSNEKYAYKYIAKHYFVDKTEAYFVYEVQKGIPFQGDGVSFILNPMVVYLMVRDVVKGILQLEKRGIYHADIKPANTICIRQKLSDLFDKSKAKDIAFKIIDFDRAYLTASGQTPEEKKLFQYAERIFNKMDGNNTLANSNTLNYQEVSRYKDLLSIIKDKVKGFELNHAQQLHQLIYDLDHQMEGKNKQGIYNWLGNRDKIYKLAKSRDYKVLIETLENIIDEQFKNQ